MTRLLAAAVASAAALVGTAGPARAVIITIAVGGDTATGAGNTVILDARTFDLDLTPGVAVTALLQTGQFNVTSFAPSVGFDTLSRTVTAGGGSEAVAQSVTFANSSAVLLAQVSINPGSTTLAVGGGRELDITPLAVFSARISAGTNSLSVNAGFLLRDVAPPPPPVAVPEPASLALLGAGAAGLAGYRWRRRAAA